MILEIIRQRKGPAEFHIDHVPMGYALSRALKSIPDGEYQVALSHDTKSGRVLPYLIGVPSLGAVPILAGMGFDDTKEIGIVPSAASGPEDVHRHFNDLMLRVRAARVEGLTATVGTARAFGIDVGAPGGDKTVSTTIKLKNRDHEDLEGDVNDATGSEA